MHLIQRLFLTIAVAVPLVSAQDWELGALGGYGLTRDATVKGSAGSVSAGLKASPVFGFFGGANEYKYLAGEASYLYRPSDLRVKGNGKEVTFGANVQFVDFRLLIHFAEREARFRPFVAIGGGVAVYTGTGAESSTQPLNNIVALTHTRDTKPMLSGAAGVKYRLTQHVGLRFEFRDSLSSFPDRVMAPVPGGSTSKWLNNMAPMFGIAGVF